MRSFAKKSIIPALSKRCQVLCRYRLQNTDFQVYLNLFCSTTNLNLLLDLFCKPILGLFAEKCLATSVHCEIKRLVNMGHVVWQWNQLSVIFKHQLLHIFSLLQTKANVIFSQLQLFSLLFYIWHYCFQHKIFSLCDGKFLWKGVIRMFPLELIANLPVIHLLSVKFVMGIDFFSFLFHSIKVRKNLRAVRSKFII